MTSQEKGIWIRRIFTLGLIGAAAAGGLFFVMPKGTGHAKTERTGLQVTKDNLAQIQASPGKLTVINMMVDGNRDAIRLKEILENLEKKGKYGDKVVMAELYVNGNPDLAASQGVKADKFAGHLDFYGDGRKLGQLVGQTDPVVVEETIDRLLAGLVQRIGKDWLPNVPGMERNRGRDVIELTPAAPKK